MSKLRIFVVDGQTDYADWFENYVLVNKLEDADLVLFTGGEDVYPKLYGQEDGYRTSYMRVIDRFGMPARDYEEAEAFKLAKELGKPMFGICRGIQFLTVMNGGTLVQDVRNHAGNNHPIKWIDGEETMTTSLHHQMCNPYNLPEDEYQILAVSSAPLSRGWYLNGEDNTIEMPAEPEVIYYPKTKSLGVQGHPEMYYDFNTPLHLKLRETVKNLLLNN